MKVTKKLPPGTQGAIYAVKTSKPGKTKKRLPKSLRGEGRPVPPGAGSIFLPSPPTPRGAWRGIYIFVCRDWSVEKPGPWVKKIRKVLLAFFLAFPVSFAHQEKLDAAGASPLRSSGESGPSSKLGAELCLQSRCRKCLLTPRPFQKTSFPSFGITAPTAAE